MLYIFPLVQLCFFQNTQNGKHWMLTTKQNKTTNIPRERERGKNEYCTRKIYTPYVCALRIMKAPYKSDRWFKHNHLPNVCNRWCYVFCIFVHAMQEIIQKKNVQRVFVVKIPYYTKFRHLYIWIAKHTIHTHETHSHITYMYVLKLKKEWSKCVSRK